MDQFILFGDSITQQSFTQADHRGFFGPALVDYYVRRMDIINRGFSGYNTRQALKVLPKFMPSPPRARVRFMMIFFGANDARLPNTLIGPQQHIPLEEYKSNFRAIATHPSVTAHEDIRIILVTPPPVDERKLIAADKAICPDIGTESRRTAKAAAKYAQAVRDLGDELQMPVLDLWSAMLGHTWYTPGSDGSLPGSKDAPSNPKLEDFLHDGLHFSRSAYKLLFDELIALIEERWPDQSPKHLPFVLPPWEDEGVWKDDKSFEARMML